MVKKRKQKFVKQRSFIIITLLVIGLVASAVRGVSAENTRPYILSSQEMSQVVGGTCNLVICNVLKNCAIGCAKDLEMEGYWRRYSASEYVVCRTIIGQPPACDNNKSKECTFYYFTDSECTEVVLNMMRDYRPCCSTSG
jgi:hypothetical protein